jgi:hypothetical protein
MNRDEKSLALCHKFQLVVIVNGLLWAEVDCVRDLTEQRVKSDRDHTQAGDTSIPGAIFALSLFPL